MKYLPSRDRFHGFQKLDSYQLLNSIGCPVLRSVLIEDGDELTSDVIKNIKDYLGSECCTVRYQYKFANSSPARGGNRVKICGDTLFSKVISGTLMWLLEPTNRLTNKYGINMYFDRNKEKLLFECVGKGFDTSNINRGDMNPHQTIEFCLRLQTMEFYLPTDYGWNLEWWKYAKFRFASEATFEGSKSIRLDKLRLLGYDDVCESIFDQHYIPLSTSQIKRLVVHAELLYNCKELRNEREFVVNCSIFEDDRLIFWDMSTPAGRANTFLGNINRNRV
jgi:hypothetical protein